MAVGGERCDARPAGAADSRDFIPHPGCASAVRAGPRQARRWVGFAVIVRRLTGRTSLSPPVAVVTHVSVSPGVGGSGVALWALAMTANPPPATFRYWTATGTRQAGLVPQTRRDRASARPGKASPARNPSKGRVYLMVGKKLIGAAFAAVFPLLALTIATTASATTAAPVTQAATSYIAARAANAHTAAVNLASIPNNECWAVSADSGNLGNDNRYMVDSGLHNTTTINGTYNACFYFSANGSSFEGYPVYQMFINPKGADCEKVIHPDLLPTSLSDQPCDDQHSGDPGESFIVVSVGSFGYEIISADGGEASGSIVAVNSLNNGSPVEVDDNWAYIFWGLSCITDC